MKKVALSLLAFALIGFGAFADDMAPSMAVKDVVKNPVTFSLDVNASASWGYDLDYKTHGFANAVTSKITLWLLNGTSTHEGEGAIHGYIQAADVKYGTDDANAAPTLSFGDVTAKIIAGDLYVKLYTNTDASQAYGVDGDNDNGGASIVADDTFYNYSAKYGGTSTEWTTGTLGGYSSFSGTGIEIGYSVPKTLDFVANLSSHSDWTATTQGGYEASGEVSLTSVDKLVLKGKFYTGKSTDSLTAFGATFGYDLGVAMPFLDLNYDVTNALYESDLGAKLPLADGLKAVVVAKYNSDKVADLTATVDIAKGKVAGPLYADVGYQMKDVTKAVATAAATSIFAKVGVALSDTIDANATVNMYNSSSSTDSAMFIKAQLEYTGISLTTLGVYYDSSDMGATKGQGDNKNGKVVLTAKVTY